MKNNNCTPSTNNYRYVEDFKNIWRWNSQNIFKVYSASAQNLDVLVKKKNVAQNYNII